MSHYFPHTPADKEEMLRRCGVESVDDLYADVPEQLRFKGDYNLPPRMSEEEIRRFFSDLAAKNIVQTCFAGGGYYDHYIPAVVDYIVSRSEFLTAYTPYQPEVSQGTLRYIFEYQSMMASLTGMDVSNASMYDGPTAVAEALIMAVASARKKSRVLVSKTLNPIYRKVIYTYARYHSVFVDNIPEKDGVTNLQSMAKMLGEGDVAAVILPLVNDFGVIEDYTGVAETVHAAKALLVMTSYASDLGVLKSPGEWGADIAAGEAQSLGLPMSFGGPGLGYLCCRKALMRKLPGRIAGATSDGAGRRVFVLTLQAREQHIRREKATSNICSNQGVMTLCAAVYLSLMGSAGLREVNEISCEKAHYLARRLEATGVMKLKYPDLPFLNEFVMKWTADQDSFDNFALSDETVNPGLIMGDDEIKICVTEKRTLEEIDAYVERLKGILLAFGAGNKNVESSVDLPK